MNSPETDIQTNIMNEKGAITVLYIETEQQRKGMISKDGTFITIEAKVKENASDGTVKLTLDSGNFEDYDFNSIGFSLSPGEVIIKNRYINFIKKRGKA